MFHFLRPMNLFARFLPVFYRTRHYWSVIILSIWGISGKEECIEETPRKWNSNDVLVAWSMSRDRWAGKKIGREGGVLDFRDGDVSASSLHLYFWQVSRSFINAPPQLFILIKQINGDLLDKVAVGVCVALLVTWRRRLKMTKPSVYAQPWRRTVIFHSARYVWSSLINRRQSVGRDLLYPYKNQIKLTRTHWKTRPPMQHVSASYRTCPTRVQYLRDFTSGPSHCWIR